MTPQELQFCLHYMAATEIRAQKAAVYLAANPVLTTKEQHLALQVLREEQEHEQWCVKALNRLGEVSLDHSLEITGDNPLLILVRLNLGEKLACRSFRYLRTALEEILGKTYAADLDVIEKEEIFHRKWSAKVVERLTDNDPHLRQVVRFQARDLFRNDPIRETRELHSRYLRG